MAEETIEPRGEWREDLRAGIVASSNVNLWRGKQGQPVSPSDFMPFIEKPKRDPDAERDTLVRKFMMLTAMMGGVIADGKKKS